jgi:hypothetical protein
LPPPHPLGLVSQKNLNDAACLANMHTITVVSDVIEGSEVAQAGYTASAPSNAASADG